MSRIKLNLRHVDPVKYGLITGLLLAIMSLIIVIPLFLFMSLAGASQAFGEGSGMPAVFGGIFMLFIPVLYGVIGFIVGLISTAVMNFILGKINGIDIEFETSANITLTENKTDNKIQF